MSESSYTCHLLSGTDNQLIEVTKEIIVGRGDSCDLIVKTGQTSRQHAKLTPTHEGLWVEDLKSSNGTFVNGHAVEGKVLAKNNDVIRFDTVNFTVQHQSTPVEIGGDDVTIVPAKKIPESDAPTEISKPSASSTTTEATPVVETTTATVTTNATPAETTKEAITKETSTQEPATKESSATESAVKATAVAQDNASPRRDAVTPPSWAMQRQQSVAGTEILDRAKGQSLSAAHKAALEKVTVPTLIGKSEPIENVRFVLEPNKTLREWEVGRAEPAAIIINHTSVSTSHAQIINDGDRWKLVDLVSANGTFVNDVKGLTTYLKHGDIIQFGQIQCQFLLPLNAAVQIKQSSTIVRSQSKKKPVNLVALGIVAVIIASAVAVLILK